MRTIKNPAHQLEPTVPSTQLPGFSEAVLLVFALLITSATRRVYLTYRGSRFRPERTIIFAAVYAAVGAFVSVGSFYEGVPILLAPIYALFLAVAVVASERYSDHRITFWSHADGSVHFRGGVAIYVVYLAALVVRVIIDYAVIGPSALSNIMTAGYTLTGAALYGTVVTDLLLMFGVGLLIGRSARVLARYSRIKRGEEAISTVPSPLGSRLGPRKGAS